ncbi:hypothetical protein D7V97_06665 [Corallococcus sp. CA053C]|uniref:hypothetical protein n=1 Tax=Corallococcus sp. CA053C TaxID=2316732 RepID=UPI000EA04F06|nr:hypothetical protein [Corallococcus sp. CA053C]RKH13040.1 hypothetical protein D7V97_06665 [Corallococcus sp. CA053C]
MKASSKLFLATLWFVLFTASSHAGEEVLLPPGDCTKDVYRALNQATGAACKTEGMSCNAAMSCQELTVRWNRFANCIQARRVLMDRCFRGGDLAHKSVLATYATGQARCTELIGISCRPTEQCH